MSSDVRWAIASLPKPPNRIFAGAGDLTEHHRNWTQDSRLWMLIYYHHCNAVTISSHTYAVEPGDIAVMPPGAPCSHSIVGDNYRFDYLGFGFEEVTGIRAAIPHVSRKMEWILPNLRKASNRVVDTPAPCQAFIWNFLWLVGQSPSLFRERESLYEAEDFISRNLQRKFTVVELAEACGVSARTLLTMFRQEHGVTIQEYVLRKRVQEASRLLLNSNLPIKEVANRVGMSDLQYFNKTMRAISGLAPTKLREQK